MLHYYGPLYSSVHLFNLSAMPHLLDIHEFLKQTLYMYSKGSLIVLWLKILVQYWTWILAHSHARVWNDHYDSHMWLHAVQPSQICPYISLQPNTQLNLFISSNVYMYHGRIFMVIRWNSLFWCHFFSYLSRWTTNNPWREHVCRGEQTQASKMQKL